MWTLYVQRILFPFLTLGPNGAPGTMETRTNRISAAHLSSGAWNPLETLDLYQSCLQSGSSPGAFSRLPSRPRSWSWTPAAAARETWTCFSQFFWPIRPEKEIRNRASGPGCLFGSVWSKSVANRLTSENASQSTFYKYCRAIPHLGLRLINVMINIDQ